MQYIWHFTMTGLRFTDKGQMNGKGTVNWLPFYSFPKRLAVCYPDIAEQTTIQCLRSCHTYFIDRPLKQTTGLGTD